MFGMIRTVKAVFPVRCVPIAITRPRQTSIIELNTTVPIKWLSQLSCVFFFFFGERFST